MAQVKDGDRFFVDEVQRVGRALRLRAGGMDMRGHVELAELLVERIPVAVAERGRLRAAVFIRVRIEQAAREAERLHHALELGQHVADGLARGLRQAADANELVRHQLDGAADDVVGLFGEPVDDARRLGAVHHLERPGRDALAVDAELFGKGQVAERRHFLLEIGGLDLFVGDLGEAAAVLAAMGEDRRLVGPQFRRRADMRMAVDDHVSSPGAAGLGPACPR